MGDNSEFEVEQSVSEDQLAILYQRLDEAIELENAVEQMEADLKAAKANLHNMCSVQIPDLMTQLQIERQVRNGYDIKLQPIVSGSLPKEPAKRSAAISWLEQHEGGELIKTEVKLSFGRSEHQDALKLAKSLKEKGLEPLVESGVHAQTLCAFARERIANGEEIDTEVLGLYTGKVVKFKRVN